MVKSGMDDDTVMLTVRTAKVINFDLTPAGLQQLADGGVNPPIISAMKLRAARKTTPATSTKTASPAAKPAASH